MWSELRDTFFLLSASEEKQRQGTIASLFLARYGDNIFTRGHASLDYYACPPTTSNRFVPGDFIERLRRASVNAAEPEDWQIGLG